MKKLLFILFISALVTGVTFAQTVEFNFEPSAEVTFGVDLADPISTGFTNTFTLDGSLVLREEADHEYGEGDVYGYINLNDLKVELDIIDEDDAGEEKDLGDNSSTKRGFVVTVGDIDAEIRVALAGDDEFFVAFGGGTRTSDESEFGDAVAESLIQRDGNKPWKTFESALSSANGFSLGVRNLDIGGPAEISLGILSEGGHDENLGNSYSVYLAVDHVILPDLLTHDLLVSFDLTNVEESGDDYYTSLGGMDTPDDTSDDTSTAKESTDFKAANTLLVGYNITPEFSLGDYGILIPVGLDLAYYIGDGHNVGEGNSKKAESLDFQAKLGFRFDWSSLGGSLENEVDTFTGDESDVPSGVELGGKFFMGADYSGGDNEPQAIGGYLRFYEDGGDAGLLPFLGAEVAADFDYYLAGALEEVADLAFGLYLDADLTLATPYLGVSYALYDVTDKQKEEEAAVNVLGVKDSFKAKAGVDITMIDNVTFKLGWASGNLLLEDADVTDDKASKAGPTGIRLDEKTAARYGEISLGAEISF